MAVGRPREFDIEQALDKALEVFWRNGYEGATIADLTVAMGINPPSLYAAFGNKEALFRKALDRYVQKRVRYWQEALAKPTARGMLEHLLHESANFLTEQCNPPGCLLVRGAIACSEAAESIGRELAQRRAEGERLLRARLEAAQRTGEFPAELEPAEFARYIMTVLEGMSVQAAAGASRQELHRVAELALRSWPA
ncbi:MAG TPA: TetR/AcrR family transcriptional regulator [Hyphomicrobiaceae bacterium]|nr:TetR/AcrR family transcriptional regulator [Hyphomicrobiaceae bacterium]